MNRTGLPGNLARRLSALTPIVIAGAMSLLPSGSRATESDSLWFEGFDANAAPSSIVEALVEYKGLIVAGGWFTEVGGLPMRRVAGWGGVAWHPFGEGFDADVYDLALFEGELIAAGAFTHSGRTAVNAVARWDGTAWRPLGPGLQADVVSLAVYRGELVAGGFFDIGGPNRYGHLARWNGVSWRPVGLRGADDAVWDMQVWHDQLVIGGAFSSIDGVARRHVAAWDGSSWHDLGGGVDGNVHALATFQGDLIVGGRFTLAGTVGANFIARWDGSNWYPLGDGLDSRPYAVEAFGDDFLVAGGTFLQAGSGAASHVALWCGTAWEPIGSGVNDNVSEVLSIWPSLYLGGRFTSAGGKPSYYVARWDAVPAVDAPEGAARLTLLPPQPNPTSGPAVLRWAGTGGARCAVEVLDLSGRRVVCLPADRSEGRDSETRWDGRDERGAAVANGVYWIRLTGALQGSTPRKLVIIR